MRARRAEVDAVFAEYARYAFLGDVVAGYDQLVAERSYRRSDQAGQHAARLGVAGHSREYDACSGELAADRFDRP